ncbi:MAG: hypothetical protein JWP00_4280 [Chloroflexi bacterium]|jgi:hypothetical protein|nr:hypothetical protein [Chloroflexota bacterium]
MPTQTYFEMLEMLEAEVHPGRPGRPRHLCPVCRLTLQGVDRFLHLISLENVTDVDTRLQLRQAGGFCNRHSYQWANLHDALGTAIIYEDLLREAAKRIEKGEFLSRRSNFFGRSSSPENPFSPCPVCLYQEEIENRVASDFAGGFGEQARFRQAYAAPQVAGTCLPHYRRVVSRLDGPLAEEFSDRQREKFKATQNQLKQIIDKMDAGRKLQQNSEEERQQARSIGDEREALTRAIWQMAGLEDLS